MIKHPSSTTLLLHSHTNSSSPATRANSYHCHDPSCHVIASPEKLSKDLEKELAGDPSEIRSCAWYHGSISREHAETLVTENGDFLVRDCISKPGDFALTCRWKGTPLNFMIESIVGNCAPGHLPPLTFRFEDESYPTIQQLVKSYQTRAKPVTQASGAVIKRPLARRMPLSYYDTKYGALVNFIANAYIHTPNQSPKSSPFLTPTHSPSMNRKGVVWTGSHPALNLINKVNDSMTRRGGQGHHSGSSSDCEGSRSSSLDKCESLPVINLIPPGGGDEGGGGGGRGLLRDGAPLEMAPPPPTKAKSIHPRFGSEPSLAPNSCNTQATAQSDANNNPNSHGRNGQVGENDSVNTNNYVNAIQPQLPPHKKGRRSLSPFANKRLLPSSSESELTNPNPPPKPSRVPSVKYRPNQRPNVVIRRNNIKQLEDDDDRDYSDYYQVSYCY